MFSTKDPIPGRAGPFAFLATAIAVMFALAAGPAAAQQIFGTALLTEHEPPDDAYWTIEDHNTPYPNRLAKDEVSGCLVAEVEVSSSGKTRLIDIQQSFPPSGLERPFKRSINRIRWVPVDDTLPEREERRQIRIDFCISYESIESARLQCVQSALQACQ